MRPLKRSCKVAFSKVSGNPGQKAAANPWMPPVKSVWLWHHLQCNLSATYFQQCICSPQKRFILDVKWNLRPMRPMCLLQQNAFIVQLYSPAQPKIPPEQCASKMGHGHGWSSLEMGHGQGLWGGLAHPRNIEPGMNSPFGCGGKPIPGPILPARVITYKHIQLYLSIATVSLFTLIPSIHNLKTTKPHSTLTNCVTMKYLYVLVAQKSYFQDWMKLTVQPAKP